MYCYICIVYICIYPHYSLSSNDSTASRPNEPELRYHVAAKLGQDWRSVCTYLGLQHYELDQANMAHAKLEDKAMEALVMWLRGQEKSRAPQSWKTLVEALHWAGHNDIASDLERRIKSKTLEVSAPQAPKKLTTHSESFYLHCSVHVLACWK